MKHHTLLFSKIEKVSQNLSSAAVVIGTLRVKNSIFSVSFGTGMVCKLLLFSSKVMGMI